MRVHEVSRLGQQQISAFGLSDQNVSGSITHFSIFLQLMAKSGSCAAQSVCEKRNEEGPNTWPVSTQPSLETSRRSLRPRLLLLNQIFLCDKVN